MEYRFWRDTPPSGIEPGVLIVLVGIVLTIFEVLI